MDIYNVSLDEVSNNKNKNHMFSIYIVLFYHALAITHQDYDSYR